MAAQYRLHPSNTFTRAPLIYSTFQRFNLEGKSRTLCAPHKRPDDTLRGFGLALSPQNRYNCTSRIQEMDIPPGMCRIVPGIETLTFL
jgi:hypothetical protein